jgi:1-acyl-sn-glycerol-3-phosphate acyltransferase
MKSLKHPLLGVVSLLYLSINTLAWCGLLFVVTVLRLVIPLKGWRKFCGKLSAAIADGWVFCNNMGLQLSRPMHIEVEGLEGINRREWYLILANHQTWSDIPILQKVFFRRIPMLKFFLKQELIWVPVLGQAWWALDFPFMKRYSKEFLKKHPHLKGKDVEITRRACRKFQDNPVSIINFVEGTRFTPEKHRRQQSPFNHLLRPKAGGIGFVLSAMGEQLSGILGVTVFYPDGVKTFWEFLCGKVTRVHIKIKRIPITDDLLGNYVTDREYRMRFQAWLNDFWQEKDAYLEVLKNRQIN